MTTHVLTDLVRFYCENDKDPQSIDNILQEITSRNTKFISLVESLGSLLSSTIEKDRANGTELLTSVLIKLPTDFLTDKEVDHLVEFYTNRVKEVTNILPSVLNGLNALSQFENLSSQSPSTILLSAFQALHVSSLLQPERYAVFTLLHRFLAQRIQHLLELSSEQRAEILVGFLQASDGERDPRCLLVIFRISRILATAFDTGSLTEELFEAISCYFPIDFNPPENDDRGITRPELNEALQSSLSCTATFAVYLVPFLLEKLESDLATCKVDSFLLLSSACKNYRNEDLQLHLTAIWSRLRREILTTTVKEIEDSAMAALKSVTRAISNDVLVKFLEGIWKECEPLLDETADGLRMLIAVASASDPAHLCLVNLAVPVLLSKLDPPGNSNKHIACLGALYAFLEIPTENKELWKDYGPKVVETFFSYMPLGQNNVSVLTLKGLRLALIKCPFAWTETQFQLIQDHIEYWIKEDSVVTNNREDWKSLVLSLSTSFPALVLNRVFPLCLQNLKDTKHVEHSLAILSTSCSETNANQFMLNEILKDVKKCSATDAQLDCLIVILSQKFTENSVSDKLYHTCFMPLVVDILQTAYGAQSLQISCDKIFAIVEIIVPRLSNKYSDDLFNNLFKLVLNQNSVNNKVQYAAVTYYTKDIINLTTDNQTLLLKLFRSTFGYMTTTTPNLEVHQVLLLRLCHLAFELPQPLSLIVTQIIAALINKLPQTEALVLRLMTEIDQVPLSANVVTLWIWLTKALVIRGLHTTGFLKLISLLKHEEFGSMAADGYPTILSECSDILNARSKANVSLFYKQKFFLQTKNELLNLYMETENTVEKNNCLRAICHQLRFLPAEVLQTELPQLLPVLIKSLLITDMKDEIQIPVLNALKELLKNNAKLAIGHIEVLLSRLLLLSKEHKFMKARESALECLFYIGTLPDEHILLFINQVVKDIKPCLNDHKRLVRIQAAKTSCRWHFVGNTKE